MMRLNMPFVCLFFVATFLAVASTSAQSTNADFQQAVAAYQQSPSDATVEKVIKMAAAMDQPPPIPNEARRYFVRGAALIKDAKSPADSAQAANEFLQAARLAPWWPEARYNTAAAFEAAGNYANAIANLKIYQMFKLSDTEARSLQDKIWALEAKQEKGAKEAEAKAKESSPATAAAREQNKFEDWLKKLDGRRYTRLMKDGETSVIDVRGNILIWGFTKGGYQQVGGNVGRIEIKDRETTVPFTPNAVSMTVIISEDGDRITQRVRFYDGDVRDWVHLWQR